MTQTKSHTEAWLSRFAQPIDAQGRPVSCPCGLRPRYLVPSQSKPNLCYTVNLHREELARGRCQCEAGHRGVVCVHLRAAFEAFTTFHDTIFAVKKALVSNPEPFVYHVWAEGESWLQVVEHNDEESGRVAWCGCGGVRQSWRNSSPCVHIALADAASMHHIPRAYNCLQSALRDRWNCNAVYCDERPLRVGEEGEGV